MRRRLALLVLSVTSLVVIAFTLPLALMVARQADERARSTAERDAQAVAAAVVREVVADQLDPEQLAAALEPLPVGVVLTLPDGTLIGEAPVGGVPLAGTAAEGQRGQSVYRSDGSWELALPVLTRQGALVVSTVVPRAELRRGVNGAWLLLGLLGLGLIGASMALASRLARSLTVPVEQLADAARSLAAGDLDTRVAVEDPPEFAAVANAFNRMAPRLQQLIAAEREEVADLSHRLRTPLTSLRLQAEAATDPEDRDALLGHIDRLQSAVDQLIAEARHRPEVGGTSLVDEVVERRTAFWRVLADEQARKVEVETAAPGTWVEASDGDLGAVLDALVGNVFEHTDAGIGFSVSTALDGGVVTISVADEGVGFPEGFDPLERGVSGGGSTGLGLDIARRLAVRCGGSIELDRSPRGGALIRLVLPVVESGPSEC